MSAPPLESAPDLTAWAVQAAVAQGLELDSALTAEVALFLALARDMAAKLPDAGDAA